MVIWGTIEGCTAGLSFRLTVLVFPCRRIIWRSHICSLFIYPNRHIHSIVYPVLVRFLTQSPCTLSKHTRARRRVMPFLERVTLERTSLNAQNLFPLPPLPASGLAFISMCKPPDHMGSGGLRWPLANPPWRACCLRGIQGYFVFFSVASNFG